MGSGQIKRRKPRRRLPPPDVGSGEGWAWPETPGSQYTFTGYIRGLGLLATGRGRASGWRRIVGTVLVWLILGPVLVGIATGLFAAVSRFF